MELNEIELLYKETNEKFKDRVNAMLLEVCGCSNERALEVLELAMEDLK